MIIIICVSRMTLGILTRPGVIQAMIDDFFDHDFESRADVHSGTEYHNYRQRLPFLVCNENKLSINMTYTLNTDGVNPYGRSNQSFWPMILAINEIPFKFRFKWPYLVVAGLWPSIGKPIVNVFVREMVHNLNEFSREGITIVANNIRLPGMERGTVVVSAAFHCSAEVFQTCADMPGEKVLLGMAGVGAHEGGCVVCHAGAGSVKDPVSGRTHVCSNGIIGYSIRMR